MRDPFRPIIGAINAYLHAYHMYRAEALRMPEIERLNTVSRNALETLQRVFPYGVRSKNGTFRSWFCTEKPHAMTHWAENYETVGRIRIISTTVTETRMKSAVKTKAKKTNNQASFGGSLLINNMEVEAAMEMQLHLDETGVHRVCTNYVCEMSGFAPCLTKVCSLKTGLLSFTEQTFLLFGLHKIYTSLHSLH